MMPSGDSGFTWGRYEGRGKDRQGGEVVTSGAVHHVVEEDRGGGVEGGDGRECARASKSG